jgi:hypothetical protein
MIASMTDLEIVLWSFGFLVFGFLGYLVGFGQCLRTRIGRRNDED